MAKPSLHQQGFTALMEMACASPRKIDLFLGIYHCKKDVVTVQPFEHGFPDMPWTCPVCKVTVSSKNKLSYDLVAMPADPKKRSARRRRRA